MAQLTCELCGSTNFTKQDGFFVCGECGMKYSLAEARKMMAGSTTPQTTENSGAATDSAESLYKSTPEALEDICTPAQPTTSKEEHNASYTAVVSTPLIDTHLANARRAIKNENYPEAKKYYNKVEELDPTNAEAIFYSAYANVMELMMTSERFKREAACKVLVNCVSIIATAYTPADIFMLIQISDDIYKLATSKFVYTVATEVEEENVLKSTINSLHSHFISALWNIICNYPYDDLHFLYALMLKHCAEIDALSGTECRAAIQYFKSKDSTFYDRYVTVENNQNEIANLQTQIKTLQTRANNTFYKKMTSGCLGIIVLVYITLYTFGIVFFYTRNKYMSIQKKIDELKSRIHTIQGSGQYSKQFYLINYANDIICTIR